MEKLQGYEFWRQHLHSARLIVAPMVDQSELPWRLLSRRYGAELCYSPMYHASVFNRDPLYRKEALASCEEDRPLIIQFCANNPDTFVEAGKVAQAHCDAIDLNLGCPQTIARRGHYGAFLQEEWDLIYSLVKRCADELDVPITCKIRVFEDVDKTVRYAQMLEKAGCQLLTVHGRTREQKGCKTGLASWSHIKTVKENVKIPVFANGNIRELADVHQCLEETGVDGVMSAEGNLHNPALFSGKHPVAWEVALEYLELVKQYPASMASIRGHAFRVLHHVLHRHKHIRDILGNSKTIDDILSVIAKLKELSQEDIAKYEAAPKSLEPSDLPFPYWLCQAYTRPSPEEVEERLQEKKRQKEAEGDEDVIFRKRMKKLLKMKAYVGRGKYPLCSCSNPKGLKCQFNLCKKCCRKRASSDKTNCPSHRLFVEKQNFHKNKQTEKSLEVTLYQKENVVDSVGEATAADGGVEEELMDQHVQDSSYVVTNGCTDSEQDQIEFNTGLSNKEMDDPPYTTDQRTCTDNKKEVFTDEKWS